MKKSQLKKIIRNEIITEIERPDNEISTAEREQIEHEAIKQIAKKNFGKDYNKLPGRDKLAAGRKFLNDSDKQKTRLKKALQSLQAKGKIDPNKVYTPGTFYEGKINENEIDPYEVAKALIGTEARNKVYQSFGVDKNDYEMNDRIKGEVEFLIKMGW